jgi:cytosine/creatinine deaminase
VRNMALDLIIRRARIRGVNGRRDVGIDQGRIAAVEGHLKETATDEIDASGSLLTPGFVNIHCHLDKCLTSSWAQVWDGTRNGAPQAIPSATRVKERFTESDIVDRASRALTLSVTLGTTAVRAFADVDTLGGLLAVRSLLQVKEKFRGVLDLQVVAFPQEGLIRDEGAEELLEKSMELGADVVGGIPWYEKDSEAAEKHTDVVFRIAKKYGKDIHTLIDDNTDPSSRNLEYLLRKSIREGYRGHVAASHCRGALDSSDDAYAKKIVGLAKEVDLTVVENSHISLFMYGRTDGHPVRRGVTRVREFLEAGVNVAVAQDDIDDPYYPFGRGDMLELAFVMCHAAHLGSPQELESAFEMVTYNAAKGMRLDHYGLGKGDFADLVLLDAGGVHDALRLQPDRLLVVKRGRVVAETKANRLTHF